jgi:hypothetical protein
VAICPKPVTFDSAAGKASVLKTGTLVTTLTTVDQVVVTYTVTSGKTFFLEYINLEGSMTVPAGGTNIALGLISLESPSGTKLVTKRCVGGGGVLPTDLSIPLSEPLPIFSGTVVRVVCTPVSTTSMTWVANFGGYES